jgi:MFS family permease
MKIARPALANPLALPIYLPTLLYAIAQGLLIPVLPLYAASFSVSYGLVGLVLAGESLGMLLADLPAGVLLRRLGCKRTMLLGLGAAGISAVLLFNTDSLPQVMACRLLAGAGFGFYGLARHAYLAEATPLRQRGQSIALLGGMLRVGNFAGPATGGLLAAGFGLRAPFLLFAALACAALVCVALFTPETCLRAEPAAEAPAFHPASLLRFRRESDSQAGGLTPQLLAWSGLGNLLMRMVRAAPQSILPLYGSAILGLDARSIGLIASLSGAVDALLFYPAGLVQDRWGRKYAIVASLLGMASGLALVPLASTFTGLLLAGILAGFGNGLGAGALLTLGADLAPPQARGEFLGIWRLTGDGGATAGPLAVGGIAELFTLPITAWVIAAGGLVASAVFAFCVPETLK